MLIIPNSPKATGSGVCLGVPAKVLKVRVEGGIKYAEVDLGGVRREVIVATDEPLELGDYVIVHAGIAISKINENEVKELSKLWSEILNSLTAP